MSKPDPHSCLQADDPHIEHIRFDLEVNFDRRTLSGSADYTFAKPLGDEIRLDLRQLKIEKVAVGTKQVSFRVEETEAFLGQILVINGIAGEKELHIKYSTSPEATALQWLMPEQTAGKKYPYVFSQCQAIHARSVFPCQDTPMVRFTYDAVLYVPEKLTAVMAAESLGNTKEAGKNVCRFRMKLAIPSYLFAFAVGNIVSAELGSRSKVFAEPEVVQAAKWEYAEVSEMIESAELLFGPYLWERFDLLHMPPSFPYGGMENPRLTFLTPTLIAGDRSLVSVVAHELAHSWTGNLVTNATWEDFWLNEGFTVYAERRIVEAMYGTEVANLQSVNGRTDLDKSIADFGADSQYTKLKNDLNGVDPDDIFSSVPYEKGYLFLVAIERAVGRSEFDKFLKNYIHNFKFKSLGTEQFLNYLKNQLPGVEQKVSIDDWVYQVNLPAATPEFHSHLIDEVSAARKKWESGERDLSAIVAKWSVHQKVLFIESLAVPLSIEDCRKLEALFDLSKTKNCEIKVPWLAIAASSSYEPAFDALRDMLGEVGRGKYLRPLYKALHKNPQTKQMAADLFAKFKDRYHSVGRAAVERILAS